MGIEEAFYFLSPGFKSLINYGLEDKLQIAVLLVSIYVNFSFINLNGSKQST